MKPGNSMMLVARLEDVANVDAILPHKPIYSDQLQVVILEVLESNLQ